MSECRYTGKPLEKCDCPDGCETNRIEAGEWIQPIPEGYRMACCDCGLVHRMNFRIQDGMVQFQAFRDEGDSNE